MTKEQYQSLDRVSAYCAWPADDIVILDNWDKGISIGLTVEQAKKLVEELQIAIAAVEDLEVQLKEDSKTWE